MKKLIRKILKEEIHPDYENLIEPQDAYFKLSYAELKIGLMVLKDLGNTRKDRHNWVSNFKNILYGKYAVTDNNRVARMLLVFWFNDVSDLKYALKQKSIESLYIGPFYECVMDYYNEETDEEIEYGDVDCDECDGSGEENRNCDECGGSGEVEDDDGEYISCDRCDGSGEETTECNYCSGSGTQEEEVVIHELSQYTTHIISKEPFDMADYGNASDVLNDVDLLVAYEDWYDSVRDESDYIRNDEDNIIDVHSEDILVNNSAGYITSYFQ